MWESAVGWDQVAFQQVARRTWPAAERVLPRLSQAANHGLLWFGAAGLMAALGGRRGRRAAARGAASLAVASTVVNAVAKPLVRRNRPLLDTVPAMRQLRRQPVTTSFPSGHTASAVAFAAGVALESPRLGAALAPIAWSVGFSRIYTGAHYPSDVLVGAAIGAGAAYAVRMLVPTRVERAVPPQPRVETPALPGGEGLHIVLNDSAGPASLLGRADERLAALLPRATLTSCTAGDDLAELLDEAAQRAAASGGALGVHGGDGTVNIAARVAARRRVPLAVFPGGTYNHFCHDLGIDSVDDTARAVEAGSAVAVDVARFRNIGGAESVAFLNTFSIGAYPDMVRYRERWSPRIGSLPAGVLAAVRVLRTTRPVRLQLNGRRRSVWLLFVGNCAYRHLGPVPVRRADLADGLLDVRVVNGGRFARTRLLLAALTGDVTQSPFYSAALVRGLRIDGIPPRAHLAYDGEIAAAPADLVLDKLSQALTVYRE